MSKALEFAVVGHPNKGKSSLVASLAQDDSVLIAPQSGTTKSNQRFPLTIDGKTLYTLVDTPGFQRAREVYEWLQAHSDDTADRVDVIRQFIDQFKDDERFDAETQLLTPILNGAGIIYVIDGSRPYGPEYEVEMEILRWTGQPSMALINLISQGDYIEQWRKILNQYFKIVRVFNPLKASFDERIGLLRGFSHLDERWTVALNKATEGLITQRHHLREQCAENIASLLESALGHTESRKLKPDADAQIKTRTETELEAQFQQSIAKMETDTHEKIKILYQQHQLHITASNRQNLLNSDLFSEEAWKIFGLDHHQLLTTSVTGGALAGGALDLAVAGYSFFLGAGIGAAAAGVATWFASHQLAKISVLGTTFGGVELTLGPIKNRNFPYVLLSRALLYQHLTETHSHANRSETAIEVSPAMLKNQDLKDRLPFEKLFHKLRKNKLLNPVQHQKLAALLLESIDANQQSD